MNFSGNSNEEFLFRLIEKRMDEGEIENLDFFECSISGYDFSYVEFKNVSFEKAALVGCIFNHCTFENVNFRDVTIEDCIAKEVKFINTNAPF